MGRTQALPLGSLPWAAACLRPRGEGLTWELVKMQILIQRLPF